MKNLLLIFILSLNVTILSAQGLQLLGHADLPSGQEGSGLWGYTSPSGREYAICGQTNGIAIYEVTSGTPVFKIQLPQASGIWHEVRTFGNYAYAVQDNSGSGAVGEGLMIIDLNNIDAGVATSTFKTNFSPYTIRKGHTIHIDEQGRGYINGGSAPNGGATLIIDIASNPTNPSVIGVVGNEYNHDMYCRNNKAYLAHVYSGKLEIVDYSNPSNTVSLGNVTTPYSFTHNVWLNDAGNVAFTTDEKDYAYVASYDVSDPSDIKLLDLFGHQQSTGSFPHNVHVKDDFIYTSYYAQGIVVIDAHEPSALTEVANYDTSPDYQGGGFNGSWSVFPYFASGKVLSNDIEKGLDVFQANFQRAAYVKGTVRDALTQNVLNGVTVTVTSIANETTNVLGKYIFGANTAGDVQVTYSKVGYASQTQTVTLTRGITTVLDVELMPIQAFTLNVNAIEAINSNQVANAVLRVRSVDGLFDSTIVANAAGQFTLNPMYTGDYELYCGKWGYITKYFPPSSFNPLNNTQTIVLDLGYQDEFVLDLGWTKSNVSPTGIWEREVPIATTLNNVICNADADVTVDLGDLCYVTGNGGGSAGTDDVDNGSVTLNSPLFNVSTMNTPTIKFNYWWMNGGGSGGTNDYLKINLIDGAQVIKIDSLDNNNVTQSAWQEYTVNIKTFIPNPTNNLKLQFIADDVSPGHVVEAGIDFIRIFDSTINSSENVVENKVSITKISNNTFEINNPTAQALNLTIANAEGKVLKQLTANVGKNIFSLNVAKGIYFIQIKDIKIHFNKKLIVD